MIFKSFPTLRMPTNASPIETPFNFWMWRMR